MFSEEILFNEKVVSQATKVRLTCLLPGVTFFLGALLYKVA